MTQTNSDYPAPHPDHGKGVTIPRRHSINRVKELLANAERCSSVRGARVRIAGKKWLGTWGSTCR